MTPDERKEVMEELKIVQDILLRQEEYSHMAFNHAFVVIAGLVVAFFNQDGRFSKTQFLAVSLIAFFGFLIVQVAYREAFHRGLDRSHYLQQLLGDRLPHAATKYEPFLIYESVHYPFPKWSTFANDLKNPRFLVPNLVVCLIPLIAVYVECA